MNWVERNIILAYNIMESKNTNLEIILKQKATIEKKRVAKLTNKKTIVKQIENDVKYFKKLLKKLLKK